MMKRKPSFALACAFLLAATLSAPAAEPDNKPIPAPDSQGWITLFDGKSLDGWKANSAPEAWKVVDGCITVDGPFSHLFYVGPDGNASFADFELKVEVKLNKGGNSGIFFRTPPMEQCDPYLNGSYEAQLQNDGESPCYTGGLWNRAPRPESSPVQPDEWFDVHIIAIGDRVTLKINGETTCEYSKATERHAWVKHPSSGLIALQGHGPGHRPMFRSVRIKPLS